MKVKKYLKLVHEICSKYMAQNDCQNCPLYPSCGNLLADSPSLSFSMRQYKDNKKTIKKYLNGEHSRW